MINNNSKTAKELILQIEEGRFGTYTSSIVFSEISYVLKSVYELPFSDITEVLDSTLTIRGITIVDKTNTKIALQFYKKYKIKFTDCLIASQLPKNTILVSFDEELSKI
ncbi:PIN domain-containing protein [Patescibacteria group bacterium]|nr:PIN domain-containing protein [Patescibacteria group bacterium]